MASKPNGILAMNPEQYREIDGVVFDLNSYARHCRPSAEQQPVQSPPPPPDEQEKQQSDTTPSPTRAANGILAMNPEQYREIDGVVFDLNSYARHCKSEKTEEHAPEPQSDTAPSPVFAVDPFLTGWYPAEEGCPPVPIMGGALPPGEWETYQMEGNTVLVMRTRWIDTGGSGSGSGSYVTSYITSYRTSYRSSGSGSYLFGSCLFLVGGYGLELV